MPDHNHLDFGEIAVSPKGFVLHQLDGWHEDQTPTYSVTQFVDGSIDRTFVVTHDLALARDVYAQLVVSILKER